MCNVIFFYKSLKLKKDIKTDTTNEEIQINQLYLDSKSTNIKVHSVVWFITSFYWNFIVTKQALLKLLIKSSFLCQLKHRQRSIYSNKVMEPHFL